MKIIVIPAHPSQRNHSRIVYSSRRPSDILTNFGPLANRCLLSIAPCVQVFSLLSRPRSLCWYHSNPKKGQTQDGSRNHLVWSDYDMYRNARPTANLASYNSSSSCSSSSGSLTLSHPYRIITPLQHARFIYIHAYSFAEKLP